MKSFASYLAEALLIEEDEGKLKHIHHAEDRPLIHGSDGFEHAFNALTAAHEHIKAKEKNSKLTVKKDGSPAVVFGHHPETNKFFVASKSAFNKDPKINYTDKDIEKNHGHAPGLVKKLKAALKHLPKVTPKHGVYQGDIMHTPEDHHHPINESLDEAKESSVSFTPNTITYTAKGDEAKAVKRSKLGVAIHTKYEGKTLQSMHSSPHVDTANFTHHPDVHNITVEHDTSKVDYPAKEQSTFQKHMDAAKAIHTTHGKKMYAQTAKHQGDGAHMATYINHTVRTDTVPTASGFKEHLQRHYGKLIDKVKTDKSKAAKTAEMGEHTGHVSVNKSSYDHMFQMHHHLQQAKNTLVSALETHEGPHEHHINGKKSKAEGFVVNHEHDGVVHPTKLVNRSEFAKMNLLKVRK